VLEYKFLSSAYEYVIETAHEISYSRAETAGQ
jgi:hypothetical protein